MSTTTPTMDKRSFTFVCSKAGLPVLYSNPTTKLCLNDDNGDVTIKSRDGYVWKVKAICLRAASPVFNDLLSPPNTDSIIPLDELGTTVHACLHVILRHRIEPGPGDEMFSHLKLSTPVLEKYLCDSHLGILEDQAILILRGVLRFSACTQPRAMFVFACANNWNYAAKEAIRGFHSVLPMQGPLAPEHWSLEQMKEIGIGPYRALVVACAKGRSKTELGSGEKSRADWEKVGELFKLS